MKDFTVARKRMVDEQVIARGIKDPRVIQAMLKVPRHLFVPEALQSQAYSDFPLPIGARQTISQPYMVAMMSEALLLKGDETVLEIGTGSGYQAAVLALLADRVFSLERISDLARQARRTLDSAGYSKVNIRLTDGTYGWEEMGPFDGIIVTAGAPRVPQTYLDQLAIGGRLVIPVGDRISQALKRISRISEKEYKEETLLGCRFVPLIGNHGWQSEV
ncbi:MAG: protein-L-isoaspartate(D-aspartate) O-methyltransferase [Deltaproteobacteria bacterium]|jgi:protein-L-isoaspartate(D-aspartate) O-methyltransferase|nr:protein-L-isoaspartate(D-aspartate) O-methyltransferase [Deltaproteobacteria bacterium]MBW2476812.1 protein-L-isoaspartate(D-aspartate) O-methyltransferase [Deltaproteobacteria bacterium]MBW2518742.1 protein-L-isoaspartate(D-aspartate) O-methyltransferase [Deltaproteobacteria bacterium]